MIVKLREMEPFNIETVDNHQAALFTSRLTGNETFEFDGDQKPKSFEIYTLKYNYPRHSFAHAWLLSIDIDSYLNVCNSGLYNTMEPIYKKYVIGRIEIEYGGNLTNTVISVRKVNL